MIESLTDLANTGKYLHRIGAEPRNLRTAVVRKFIGKYWKDTVLIKFSPGGDVTCKDSDYLPTKEESVLIKQEFENEDIPTYCILNKLTDLPPGVDSEEELYVFRDLSRNILMCQHRIVIEGEKRYIPWTWWSDGRWRKCEPDGALPLWGLEQLHDYSTVFIHEGAKAAANIKKLIDEDRILEHPWGEYLQLSAHLGWIGGALNPWRTNWNVLRKMGVQRIYIIADNDTQGLESIPAISKSLHCAAMFVQFTDAFPVGFDLGDLFPKKLFSYDLNNPFYKGPSFRSCLHPASWATNKIKTGKRGRPSYEIRDSFRDAWAFIADTDQYVYLELPDVRYDQARFNKVVAPFSDVDNTARLFNKSKVRRSLKLAYRPDSRETLTVDQEVTGINTHVPANVRPLDGDISPWREFLEYLFVDPDERFQIERWCATLIARPDIRIGYALLLVSETQGVGKTTLASCVLAPLVGPHNVSRPNEAMILDKFNSWMAHKRLAICDEVYGGSSWKSYNKLKQVITDEHIEVNQKFLRSYPIENWCHVIACSNSLRALKIEDKDRRWFYPEITEINWRRERFHEFRSWLAAGGLAIVLRWAMRFKEYILPGEHAPMTKRKKDLIEESRSPAKREAVRLARMLGELQEVEIVFFTRDIRHWVRRQLNDVRIYDTNYQLRKAILSAIEDDRVSFWTGGRLQVDGEAQYALCNKKMLEGLENLSIKEQRKKLRVSRKDPGEILVPAM